MLNKFLLLLFVLQLQAPRLVNGSSFPVFPGTVGGYNRDRENKNSAPHRDLEFGQTDVVDLTSTSTASPANDFVVAHLSNERGQSDFGLSNDVELMIDIVSKLHFNGDGPRYETFQVPDEGVGTVAVVQELYENRGIRVFLGPETSGQAVALTDWAEAQAPDVIFLSPSATNPSLGARQNIIQLMPSDEIMAQQLLAFVTTVQRPKISIIHNDGVYASGLADLVKLQSSFQLATSCELAENTVSTTEADDCVQHVATQSNPNDTVVILITSGRDTRELLRAAAKQYSDNNDDDDILWVGADTVAFDQNLYSDSDLAVWQGAQLVHLHGITAGRGTLRANDELTVRYWNDYLLFRPSTNDAAVRTTDISPTVLIAADALSLIFLNADGELTSGGVQVERLRIALLRQSPFLTLQSGPLRFNQNLQRMEMPFLTVRVQR